jgi:hypothetical protein
MSDVLLDRQVSFSQQNTGAAHDSIDSSDVIANNLFPARRFARRCVMLTLKLSGKAASCPEHSLNVLLD